MRHDQFSNDKTKKLCQNYGKSNYKGNGQTLRNGKVEVNEAKTEEKNARKIVASGFRH